MTRKLYCEHKNIKFLEKEMFAQLPRDKDVEQKATELEGKIW